MSQRSRRPPQMYDDEQVERLTMSQRPRRPRQMFADEQFEMPRVRASQNVRSQRIRESQAGPSSRNDLDDTELPESTQTNKAAKANIPDEELNLIVANVIKYLLTADYSKTPITRANIVKHALTSHKNYTKYILTEVQNTLREVYGYNMVALEGAKYILTNNIPNTDLHLEFSKLEKSELVLLFITLGHIFMLDRTGCNEEELFNLFRTLEIVEDNNYNHPYFGNVNRLITDKFVKQGYLMVVNVDEMPHYQWGPRADAEITPRNVLEFMSKIFDGRPLNTWPVQFGIMQTCEQPTA